MVFLRMISEVSLWPLQIHAHMYLYTYTHMHNSHPQLHACTHTDAYFTHTHTQVHARTHTHIHKITHTQSYTQREKRLAIMSRVFANSLSSLWPAAHGILQFHPDIQSQFKKEDRSRRPSVGECLPAAHGWLTVTCSQQKCLNSPFPMERTLLDLCTRWSRWVNTLSSCSLCYTFFLRDIHCCVAFHLFCLCQFGP